MDIRSLLDDYLLPHWPFLLVMSILAVIGQFTSKSVFTRERAYTKTKLQAFWWWGRETLPLHPLLTGGLLGLVWHNPEQIVPAWGIAASVVYFSGAGAASLFVWSLVKGYLKSRGINLTLPTEEQEDTARGRRPL